METNRTTTYITDLRPVTVIKARYATSLDERGFIPVFEYEINGQAVLWDCETGYVFLTSIWKALGHTKVDVIKTVQANPGLKAKRIRGGLLKIQGTWVPYQDAKALCLRAAWNIRQHLIPLFGTDIVHDCLPPHHPNYRVVCLDYLQSTPNYLSENPLLTKKRRYIIKGPSTPPPHLPLLHSPSSPMALSHILNNGHNDAHDATTDDGVVPDHYDDDDDMAVPGASHTLDFQVVPAYCPRPVPTSSVLAHDWPPLSNGTTNDIQESIETIQASILLQGLSHQDRRINRQTVPDKVVLNGREFSVLWD